MTTIICLFEQLRPVELLLNHHERLCSIQKLALALHESSLKHSPA